MMDRDMLRIRRVEVLDNPASSTRYVHVQLNVTLETHKAAQ
jgi:hypothetical protein